MMDEVVIPRPESRALRPSGPAPPLDPASVIALLEQIRATVRRGLDRIEALSRERFAPPAEADEERGRLLHQLEEERALLQSNASRWDEVRRVQIEELEHDRRLLAEAWERLEEAQIDGSGQDRAHHRSIPVGAPVTNALSGAATSKDDNPVSETILRQFEALRRDVRRTTKGRSSG